MEQHHYLGTSNPSASTSSIWLGRRTTDRLSSVEFGAAPFGQPRPVYWLEGGSAAAQYPLHRLQHALSDFAVGPGAAPGVAHSRKMTSALSDDWERMYGHPVHFAETFIDPDVFAGKSP